MSGHSKFANIKHKKEKNDAAKGKIFTIIGREIAIAVKEGGSDPANNSKLRDVIAKAKANNMPNDTIEQRYQKGSRRARDAVNYETGYIRRIRSERYGNYRRSTDGQQEPYRCKCKKRIYQGTGKYRYTGLRFLYVRRERVRLSSPKKNAIWMRMILMMLALDAGAEDFSRRGRQLMRVITAPDAFQCRYVRALEEENIPMASAEVTMIPQTYVEL